VPKKLS